MIQCKDLRICNLLLFGGHVVTVDSIDRNSIHTLEYGHILDVRFEYAQPIPLTAEWLMKFGFTKDMEGYSNGGLISLFYNHVFHILHEKDFSTTPLFAK